MAITFYDKTEAKEYAKLKQHEGYKAKVFPEADRYKVVLLGRADTSELGEQSVIRARELYHSPYIDKEIRGLLTKLNRKGLETISSCSGHGELAMAYVSFGKRLNKTEKLVAKNIATEEGYTSPIFDDADEITTMKFEEYPGQIISINDEEPIKV